MGWHVSIPRAVQLVIDDVGWREGWRLDHQGGPYRAGIDRLLGPQDYQAIAELGAALAIRPTAAMILAEWDRGRACARQPTATWMGRDWDNSSRAGDWSEAAAEVFREAADHLELALHGVGHEHWEEGQPTRAEWYARDGRKWRWEDLLGHLDLFRELLDQHGLGPAAGHRLPLSFVPCAFCYLWDQEDPRDTGALVYSAGVRLCSTPFSSADRRSALVAPGGGINHGVLVIDRGSNGVPWDRLDVVPSAVMGEVPDTEAAVYLAAERDAPRLTADEVELLLARRPAGLTADTERLIEAHLPLAAGLARLYSGCGLSADQLIAAGRAGLALAVREFEGGHRVSFDAYAEACAREAIRRAVAFSGGEAAPAPAVSAGSVCGIHWPNLLSAEPAENPIAVGHWRDYLRKVGDQPGQVLAANAREAFAQWAYHAFGRVEGHENGFLLDLTALPDEVAEVVGELPVMIEVGDYVRVGRVLGGELRPVWYRRQGSRAFLAVRAPGAVRAAITFDPSRPLQPIVNRDGTFNVFDLRPTAEGLELDLEIYGVQNVPLAPGFPPGEVEVVTGRLAIEARRDNAGLGLMALRLRGHDIQGERGTIRIHRAR